MINGKTKLALAFLGLVILGVVFLAPSGKGKADKDIAVRVLQKEQAARVAVDTVVAGVVGAAEGNQEVMMILALTQLQAAGSIINSAMEDSKTVCVDGKPECFYALGFVKMTVAIYGLPKSKDDEKKLVQAYSTAYEKFVAATAKGE